MNAYQCCNSHPLIVLDGYCVIWREDADHLLLNFSTASVRFAIVHPPLPTIMPESWGLTMQQGLILDVALGLVSLRL